MCCGLADIGAQCDLPTIELLWRLAGPTSTVRLIWFEDGPNSFIANIVKSGNWQVLEWIACAAHTTGIMVNWRSQPWDDVAVAEHTKVLNWAIARGYTGSFACSSILLSTRDDDTYVVNWWIQSQRSKEETMEALNDLPESDSFAKIADVTLTSRFPVVIEWWWTRLLEQRTPDHKFGEGSLEVGEFRSIDILDWYCKQYHQLPECFASSSDLENNLHGLLFKADHQTPFAILKWAVKKCTALDGQKLTLPHHLIDKCTHHGKVEMLDQFLHSADVLDMDWPSNIVSEAIACGRLAVLEWWDRNRGQLPPQDLDTFKFSSYAARADAVDVLEWWHTRGFPTSKRDWQKVCAESTSENACQAQKWLLEHPDLFAPESAQERRGFTKQCISKLDHARPFTLDFVNTIVLDMDPANPCRLPGQVYPNVSMLLWYCHRNNVTVASLLPLKPSMFSKMLECDNYIMAEWWLQAHLATGHRLVVVILEEDPGRAYANLVDPLECLYQVQEWGRAVHVAAVWLSP
ncbi:hypothetical protein BC828DRAFT_395592 [Blastocladiella britannica]|nr:hypothetical protein BC828DRAFT_395592 [Blastocladiella britannica]